VSHKAANGESILLIPCQAPLRGEGVTTIPQGSTPPVKFWERKRQAARTAEEIVWLLNIQERYDGDIIMITDNDVLVDKHKPLPALMCMQSTAAKIVPTEEDFIQSNINGFGNDIGKITNRITSMYEVRTKFEEDSREYKELTYRIQCGQLLQQNVIK
jgi:hypothetical protein